MGINHFLFIWDCTALHILVEHCIFTVILFGSWLFSCFSLVGQNMSPPWMILLLICTRFVYFLCLCSCPTCSPVNSCVIVRVRVVFRQTVVGDWRFDYLSGSHLQSQVYDLKMTTALVDETSATNNVSKDYPHPDNHAKEITDTPAFKPFTIATYIECGLGL